MKKLDKITKKFTFANDERDRLRDIQIGLSASQAQMDGMHIWKNIILEGVYKRLGIDGEAKKGYSKSITYNLSANEIIYTQEEMKKDMLAKS